MSAPSGVREGLKRLLPAPWRARLRALHRRHVLLGALRELRRAGPATPEAVIRRLQYGWGNESYAAKGFFLHEIIRLWYGTEGDVLECGSGLSTLVLATLSQHTRRRVVTLEHHAEWEGTVRAGLRSARLDHVDVRHASLRDYGEFTWYDVDPDTLPNQLRYVVVDGPPGSTPGNRVDLVPLLGTRLAPGCVILLDDYSRAEEQETMRAWARQYGAEPSSLAGGEVACLRLPG